VVAALVGLLVCGAPGIGPARAAHPEAQRRCAASAALEQLSPAPLHTEARLAQGAPVVVVAIGSSSTEGIGASSPASSYPARLQARLRRHCLTCVITVINKGVGGETVDQTLARFDRDVLVYRPNLVIWQVGSNDILRGEDLEAYIAAVTGGIGRLRAAGIEVVLMDMQFAPSLLVHPQVTAMESRLVEVAQTQRVALFHRFDIMDQWIVGGRFRFADMLSRDALHMTDASYDCLARLLSGALLHEARDRTP
jgi:lysophospholipase L1-like esterase